MPIVSISLEPAEVTKVCGNCKKVVKIEIKTLQLGRVAGDGSYPDDILLGQCDCGAFEVVRRVWDTIEKEGEGSGFDKHRRMVNALGEHLKSLGQHPKELKEGYKDEKAPPDLCDLPTS